MLLQQRHHLPDHLAALSSTRSGSKRRKQHVVMIMIIMLMIVYGGLCKQNLITGDFIIQVTASEADTVLPSTRQPTTAAHNSRHHHDNHHHNNERKHKNTSTTTDDYKANTTVSVDGNDDEALVTQDVEFFDGYHFDIFSTDISSSSTPASSEHNYYCRLQHPTRMGNESSFKDYDYNTTTSHYTKNLLNWIGCGYDGHAFTITLGCGSPQKPHQKLFYEAILKVSTSGIPTDPTEYKFESLENDQRNDMIKVYKTLLAPKSASGDNGEEKESALAKARDLKRTLRRYFKLPFGTIDIPFHEIYHAILKSRNAYNPNCRKRVHEMNIKSPDSKVLKTMLMEKANGVRLIEKSIYTIGKRYSLLKGLILCYKHMYHTSFLHQDISLSHIMVEEINGGEIQTQFIDFDRFKFVNENPDPKNPFQDQQRLRQVQFYQLLSLLANICSGDPKHRHRPLETFVIPNRVRTREYVEWIQNRTFIQDLITPLVTSQRCSQIFQLPNSLLKTTESNNISSSITTTDKASSLSKKQELSAATKVDAVNMLTNQLYPYFIDTFRKKSRRKTFNIINNSHKQRQTTTSWELKSDTNGTKVMTKATKPISTSPKSQRLSISDAYQILLQWMGDDNDDDW